MTATLMKAPEIMLLLAPLVLVALGAEDALVELDAADDDAGAPDEVALLLVVGLPETSLFSATVMS